MLKRTARFFCIAVWLVVVMPGHAGAADKFAPFTLKALDGSKRSLSDVRGRAKATLVAFFYPTCPYCNASFPEVQKIYDTYKTQGLAMVWINIVPTEENLIAGWQTEHGYTVPVLLGDRAVAVTYNVRGTPTHYLLDAKGQVIWTHAGYAAGDEQELEQAIRKALNL